MGHEFDVEFTWTKTGAGYTATATFICEDCGEVRKDVPAEVTVTETVAATCTETGKKVYTATAVIYNDDEKIIGRGEDKFVEQLPVIDHKYENGVCTECGAIALQAPELLSVYSRVQTSAKSTWTAVEGAEGYELWRATDKNAAESGWIRVKTMVGKDNVVYTNQGLEIGTTYYYKVRAFITDAAGERVYSKFSEVKYMPAAVVITNVYSNATFRLRLLWEEVGGAHGYQIWRKADDGSWKIVKTLGDKGNELTDNQGATTAYSNTGLEAGQTYTYKMRAFMITEDGEKVFGAYSDEFSGAVKPETPVVTGTSSKAGRAVLEWNELSGAAGYQIWMSTSEDGEYSITKSITDSKTTTYTKYELESGKTYYFKVRAYSEVDGRKSFSDYSEVVNVKVK